MDRKYIDCSDYSGHVKCTLVFSAVSEEELLQAVVQHRVTDHGYEDTPEFREMVRKEIEEAGPRPSRLSGWGAA